MAQSTAAWPGFDSVQAILEQLIHFDPTPILPSLEGVIYRDNRRGVLAGLDRDGVPMTPTVRESTAEGHWVTFSRPDGSLGHYYQAGRSPTPGAPPGVSEGPGKPLAPRDERSRVIANLVTAWYQDGPTRWVVFGAWEDVVSKDGVPFLPFHFRGEGKLPTRDLAGLRPEGLAEAQEIVAAWAAAQLQLQQQG